MDEKFSIDFLDDAIDFMNSLESKAQISKIENHLTDARFETILKVFSALDAKINFNVELFNNTV